LNYYNYQDRARLLELTGDAVAAEQDKEQAQEILSAPRTKGS
jgi:hypothetical protein